MAALFNAKPGEIAFTKNTSEGAEHRGQRCPARGGDNVVLIEGDHPNNTYAWLNQRRKGVKVRFVTLKGEGDIATAETFAPFVDARTRVISLSHISFHAGQRHDVTRIGRLCRNRGIYLVVDAMQSAGVVPIDVDPLSWLRVHIIMANIFCATMHA